jgi:pyrroline-5-carboxylate reductase
MGFAMMRGWLASENAPKVTVVEPNDELRARAAAAGATALADSSDIPANAAPDLIILAVKPQVMDKVAPLYASFAGSSTFVSIAAGTTIATLENLVGNAPIIRCMPNTPAAIGQGMMVCYATPSVSGQIKDITSQLLAASGEVAWIDTEDLMDAVTAISGSGPAYVFHMVECLTNAAKALDLPDEIASQLAKKTVMGAGALASQSGTTPDQLRVQVTSPGGTTAAALDVLMGDDALQTLLNAATKAARDRGRELGKG